MSAIVEIVREPPALDRRQWRDYCRQHQAALYSHLPKWSCGLADTYRLPWYLLQVKTSQRGELVGVLPLLLFAVPDQDSRLISLPYTDAAGIIADSVEIGDELLAAALKLAGEVGARHLEIRQYETAVESFSVPATTGNWYYRQHDFKIGLRRGVPTAAAKLWGMLGAKVRNQVRKAERCGCVARIGGVELLDDFFAVFSENMRDLGSPVHSRELFRRALSDELPHSRCVVVYCRNVAAAGSLTFVHRETMFNPWASSLRRFRPFCANMLLYWSMLEQAVSAGCRWFDFGRSSAGASTFRFKQQWGAEAQRLVWHVFSRPSYGWNPASESLVIEAWKAMDLDDSRCCGPALRRWISL